MNRRRPLRPARSPGWRLPVQPVVFLLATLLTVPLLMGQNMLRIESSSVEVTDGITGIPFRVNVPAFLLGSTEVSQRDYQRVMGSNPSQNVDPSKPVERVSWMDAIAFCNRLSERDGLSPCYDGWGQWEPDCEGYRLPTEAEWRVAAGMDGDGGKGPSPTANLYRGPLGVSGLQEAAQVGPMAVDAIAGDADGPLHLFGNVWEWVWDRYRADRMLDAVSSPRGPQTGFERVILGGSFLTPAKAWNQGFRSSMPPEQESAYVGFRLARTLPSEAMAEDIPLERLRTMNAPSVDLEASSDLERVRATWLNVIGEPLASATTGRAGVHSETVLEERREAAWNGRLLTLELEHGIHTRALLMTPAHGNGPWPVVVVPFYDVDTPAGVDFGGRRFLPASPRSFAHVAVLHGMAALAVRWAGENDGPGYLEVVAELARRHPGTTGLGYWVWQSQRLADWLVAQPEVDPLRLAIAGHSLGGKMALYAGAFEPRYRAVVSSEPGIALEFSNYGDPWYLGERINQIPEGADHHELLRLTAPRPFLLIAGESADGEKSVETLQRAANASPSDSTFVLLNHGTGHSPTADSVVTAMEWLRRVLMAPVGAAVPPVPHTVR